MSSDVQGPGEAIARRGLEDLKEASDETDATVAPLDTTSSPDRLPEPDLVLIPLSVALSVGSAANRHSFPPVRELLPYQHVMRSFSDSHLSLKVTSHFVLLIELVINCLSQLDVLALAII